MSDRMPGERVLNVAGTRLPQRTEQTRVYRLAPGETIISTTHTVVRCVEASEAGARLEVTHHNVVSGQIPQQAAAAPQAQPVPADRPAGVPRAEAGGRSVP